MRSPCRVVSRRRRHPGYAPPMEDRATVPALRGLLHAVLAIGSDLDLEAMLHRIVESAVELVGARYGALGVLDEAGIGLAQFLTVGVDDDTHHAIGHLPEGHGILGVLIADPRPLRLPDLRAHPDGSGSRPPSADAFLPRCPDQDPRPGVRQPVPDRQDRDESEHRSMPPSSVSSTRNSPSGWPAPRRWPSTTPGCTRQCSRSRWSTTVSASPGISMTPSSNGCSRPGCRYKARSGWFHDAEVMERIEQAVDDLDVTIKHIRSAIFGLSTTADSGDGVHDRVRSLLQETATVLGFEPTVVFDGPVDTMVPEAIAADLLENHWGGADQRGPPRRRHPGRRLAHRRGRGGVDGGRRRRRPTGSRARPAVMGWATWPLVPSVHGGTLQLDAGHAAGTILTWRAPTHRRMGPVQDPGRSAGTTSTGRGDRCTSRRVVEYQ